MFTSVPTCSHLFKPVHTCSNLFKTVHTCSHFTDYIRSSYRFWKRCQEKLHFPPVHTLLPIEAWQSAIPTTSEGRRVSSEVRLENCMQVSGWAQFGQRASHGWGKLTLHTGSDLSKLVWTCLNQSAIEWPCCAMSFFCTFKCSYSSVLRPIIVKLFILTRLIESFPMVYGLCRCIELKLSIPLGAHA